MEIKSDFNNDLKEILNFHTKENENKILETKQLEETQQIKQTNENKTEEKQIELNKGNNLNLLV